MPGSVKDYRKLIEQPWGRMFYEMIYRQLSIPESPKLNILDYGAEFCVTANHYAKNHNVTAVEPNNDMRISEMQKRQSRRDLALKIGAKVRKIPQTARCISK